MKKLIKEIDSNIANVKWYEIPATKTAKACGYSKCIERHYTYKKNASITITRHLSDTVENIYEQEDTYFRSYNGERISTAKK